MKIEIDRFVGVFDGFIPEDYCDRVINYFESASSAGFGYNRMEDERISKHMKDDVAVYATAEKLISELPLRGLTNEFADKFWKECYSAYVQQFSVLHEHDKHAIFDYKIQKTAIGGGYHIWHCEDCSREQCGRILVWMLYLNDVEEGGETEFLYLPMRVKPKKGRVVIWPAGFTHTHRGNPPISNEKYVVTGWVEM